MTTTATKIAATTATMANTTTIHNNDSNNTAKRTNTPISQQHQQIQQPQALVSYRDEAVRAGNAARKKLETFEGNLDRVSRETRAVLDEKEAELRRLQGALGRKDAVAKRVLSERRTEQQAHAKGGCLCGDPRSFAFEGGVAAVCCGVGSGSLLSSSFGGFHFFFFVVLVVFATRLSLFRVGAVSLANFVFAP